MNKKFVLVVDPFSSGAMFANRIREIYDYDVIALITNTKLPAVTTATFRSEDYKHVFYLKTIDETIKEIEEYVAGKPDHIICGSEPGVIVFDQLSDKWNLLPNIPSLSPARRDKYLMQSQLKKDGVKHIPHFKSSKIKEILQWCEENQFDEYVIKPINSFCTDGVFFCKGKKEVMQAFARLINTTDYFGNVNAELLIEEKIFGNEYVVDAVSSEGKHFVVNIFRYVKEDINGSPIYRKMITEDVNENRELVDYVCSVLTSLGIMNGASHNEVILTPHGPVLVESGARMHGGLGPRLVEKCNSHSLIDLSIKARISSEDFKESTQTQPLLSEYVTEYFLSSPTAGTVVENNIERLCSGLSSYWLTTCKLLPGDYVAKTVDLVTSCGRVVLASSDRTVLESDAQKVGEFEADNRLLSII